MAADDLVNGPGVIAAPPVESPRFPGPEGSQTVASVGVVEPGDAAETITEERQAVESTGDNPLGLSKAGKLAVFDLKTAMVDRNVLLVPDGVPARWVTTMEDFRTAFMAFSGYADSGLRARFQKGRQDVEAAGLSMTAKIAGTEYVWLNSDAESPGLFEVLDELRVLRESGSWHMPN